MKSHSLKLALVVGFLVLTAACSKQIDLSTLKAPDPIPDNSGKYLCPYTSDGVLAQWVDKAQYAGAAKNIGGAAVGYAAEQVLSNTIPFVGGYIGSKVGESAGRAIGIAAAGGWDFIKSTSDLSFITPKDMAVWMYVSHHNDQNYPQVLRIVQGVYPELEKNYQQYLNNAAKGK